MKVILFAIVLVSLTACTLAPASPTAWPTPTNPWMGQSLPGITPIPFGMSFLPSNFHSSTSFTPDGKQAYWAGSFSDAMIYTSRLEDGSWTKPTPISFSDKMTSYRDPFVSPDGMRLYFISMDAIPGSSSSAKENIWMVEKTDDGWGEPQPLPDTVNAYDLHWTISVAYNYNLYFSVKMAGENNIYLSRYINGEYTEAVPLGSPVNTAELEITPNIAPDESYLLFSRVADQSSTPYLYISYAQKDGWSEPQKVSNIRYCISPIITPDRMFVIYLSSPNSLEWRNTSFIDELRP